MGPESSLSLVRSASNCLAVPCTSDPRAARLLLEQGASSFHLAADPIFNKFGAMGMLVIDPNPKEREVSYADPEWTGNHYSENSNEYLYGNDPVRKAHYVDTELGFSLLRYYVLPECIVRPLSQRKHTGHAMIRDLLDGGVPEAFDEEVFALGVASLPEKCSQLIDNVVNLANGILPEVLRFAPKSESVLGHYANISFHSWAMRNIAVDVAQSYLAAGLKELENFLSRFSEPSSPLPELMA